MHARLRQRAVRLAALAAAAASCALYAQTVGLKPGLYEFTSLASLPPEMLAKIPPQYQAMMQKPIVTQHCITQGDIDHVSQQISQGRSNQPESCTVTEHAISGSAVKFTTQCPHHTTRFEGTFAGEGFEGSAVSTSDKGQTTTVKISAHRVGDCSK